MSADEYLALGETQERYELIDGVVVMSPSPFPNHQRVVREVLFQFESFRRANPSVEVLSDIDIWFSPTLVLRPDVVVFSSITAVEAGKYPAVAPDLAVEVLSFGSQSHDLLRKREAYRSFGVLEYWVIDPEDGNVRCWRLQEGEYAPFKVSGDVLESTAIPGLVLDLLALRRITSRK